MKNNKIGVLLLFLLLFTMGAKAQQASSMRINEVLVINEDNFMDDYGKRNAWIELYNTSAGTVDIRGCYFTNDKNNPTKYPIPKGDVLTKIKPGQHTLFWADNRPEKGTFHLNFSLDPDKDNYVALYDADGKTIIDEITIPAAQKADVSFGRLIDGLDEMGHLPKVTPSTNNVTLDSNDKIENLKENDSLGVGMTITAMMVVFSGLLMLFFVFKAIGKVSIAASKRNAQKAAKAAGQVSSGKGVEIGEESGELFAAIATALYEATEDTHDEENTVITIQKVTRNYSPWSSKIYGLRDLPRK